MPTYEYRCPEGHEFERFQRMSDEPKADCPQCGAGAQRLLSAGGGLLFRGSGFYITDYRSESYRKAQKKAEAGGTSAGGKGSSSGGDSGGSGSSSGGAGSSGGGSGASGASGSSGGGSGSSSGSGSTPGKA
ncbi:MAG: zinc ribbon domain-containing protein [Gemmatimonadales bacterium]|nr:MAG: zinc ribbon domain-containing protein [Gemmatimonadales bacterium]